MKIRLLTICAVVLVLSSVVSAAEVAGWNAFVIRNSSTGGVAPVISDDAGGGKLFQIVLSGQKAAWGTNSMTGKTIGDIRAISITRDASVTGWGPYMNFWVTDGQGGYAVLSNEPSHTGEWAGSSAYNTTWDVLKNATAWVYEVSPTAGFKLPNGTTIYSNMGAGTPNPLHFEDFAQYLIATPTVHWGGGGAPDDLNAGSYTAYGINWVFGDTQSNYLDGYLVASPRVLSAGITINVFASSAPNAYGGSSWTGYTAKALYALENCFTVNGDRSTDPTAYEVAAGVVGPGEIAVTSFKSWRGEVNPVSPFQNEYGSRMHFGLHATGDGTQQFTLENLTFALHSSDESDSLVFTGDFIGYTYNGTTRYGINWGADRVKGGGDDVTYTSGNGTTLVDEIVYVGVGNAWWPTITPELPTAQDAMDDYFAWIASEAPDNVDVTCTYNILSYSGSDKVTIAADNVLKLDAQDDPVYMQPGEFVVIDMDALNLAQEVFGCQAILNFSSTYFKSGAGEVDVQAGGGVWNELIWGQWTTGGDLDVAVGVDLDLGGIGTRANGTVAKFTLTAADTEGVTQMVFRPDISDIESTFFADSAAQAVYPAKVDSQDIVIDGTEPLINIVSAVQGGNALLGGGINAIQGDVTITVAASDALAGLDGIPAVSVTPNGAAAEDISATGVDNNDGTFTYTFTVTAATANGAAAINASVSDMSGNTANDSDTFDINKNQITGSVELEGFAGATRAVTFVTNGGTKSWTPTLTFTGTTASFTLTDVPAGTTQLSAKANWNLRVKLAAGLDGNGQAAVNFTGASKLRGGDLNGSNSTNILDFAVLKTNWFTYNAVADITGDGSVTFADFVLLKANWFQTGDAL